MRVVTERLSTRPPVPSAPAPATTLDAPPAPGPADRRDVRRMALAAAPVAAGLFAASLALSTRTGMWLDEAQTLSISRLPVRDLLDALRTDGAPPLYYLLLHGWMALAGTSEIAARALSAVFAVGAVALVPLAGGRVGGRRVAAAAVVLLATAPFMHRYATEARMYTLVVLLTVAGFLALAAALEQPSARALGAVAAVTGLLVLTHYWAFFLLAVVAALLAVEARRSSDPHAPAWRCLAAMAAGSLLFVPWLPTLVHQLRHTGAPWASDAGGWVFEASLRGFAGGRGQVGLLGFVYLGLFVLGLFGRPLGGGRIELDLRGRPRTRSFAIVVAGTLVLALIASEVTDSAFAPRYAAVVVLPFVLLAARGLSVLEHRRAASLILALVVGVGLVRSADEASATRTQARDIASVLEKEAQPGDLVAFCPDQLAPAVVRLLSSVPVTAVAFPPGGPVERVNWVDYRSRVAATGSRDFADSLHRQAGGGTVWLAWAPGYHSLGRRCELVMQALRRLRPAGTHEMAHDYSAFEHASLWRFPHDPDQ